MLRREQVIFQSHGFCADRETTDGGYGFVMFFVQKTFITHVLLVFAVLLLVVFLFVCGDRVVVD